MSTWNQKVGMRKPVSSLSYDIIRYAAALGYPLSNWQKDLLRRGEVVRYGVPTFHWYIR